MLKFIEDFSSNSYANIDIPGRWDFAAGSTLSSSPSAGPFGDGAIIYTNNNNSANGYIQKANLSMSITTFANFWYKFNAAGTQSNTPTIFGILNSGGLQCLLGVNSIGQLVVYRGSGTVLGTSSVQFVGVWVYVQCKFVINTGTSGSVEVRVNGTPVIGPITGINTAGTGVSGVNGISIGHYGSGGNNTANGYSVASLIVNDDSGSINNSWLPLNTRVYPFLPSSNGTYTQFTPLSGSNWQEVSSNPSTGDLSYNHSSTTSNKDTFNHAALASNVSTVLGVQTQFMARIDDAGVHTGSPVLYDGTTEVDGAAGSIIPNYAWIEQIQETNLTSGSAFTPTDINNLQFGYKLVS